MSATARAATTRTTTSRAARTRPATRTSAGAAARRPAGRPAARTAARSRPTLREVPAARPAVAGNGTFALIVVAMLVGGMGVLLVLNTSLAQGAFEIGALTRAQHDLAVQEQQLQQTVALAESPESLQARATKLGMVPASSPVFLRLADGAVLGDPKAATRARTSSARTTAPSSTDAAVADTPSDGAVADPATPTKAPTTTTTAGGPR